LEKALSGIVWSSLSKKTAEVIARPSKFHSKTLLGITAFPCIVAVPAALPNGYEIIV
jgi:hypothetical protein